jgi:hypothetical protein
MSKMFSNDDCLPLTHNSNASFVWNLHTAFLNQVINAPNTTAQQKFAAVELLNMIKFLLGDIHGITKETSNPG